MPARLHVERARPGGRPVTVSLRVYMQNTPDTTIGRTGIPRGVPDCSINSGRDPGLRKNRIRDPELPKNCVRDPELWCFQPGSRIENTGFRDPEDIVFAMF